MKEKQFFKDLSQEASKSKIVPSNESWEILESKLDEFQYKKNIRLNIIRTIAATLFLGIIALITFYEKDQNLILEGPVTLRATVNENIPENTFSGFARYQRLKDYDRRTKSNIQVVKNASMHHKYADLVEHMTKPHAFHPEDFNSEVEFFRYQQKLFDLNEHAMAGNWYLNYGEGGFQKNLKLDIENPLKWVLTSEAIEAPQEYLRIPGQKKYYIKQQNYSDLVIIEIIDNSTMIMKKYDPISDQFEEALYQKRDIG